MRTHIDIDEELLHEAIKLSGCKNRTAAIRAALEAYVKQLHRRDLLNLRGKIKWRGDVKAMRRSWTQR